MIYNILIHLVIIQWVILINHLIITLNFHLKVFTLPLMVTNLKVIILLLLPLLLLDQCLLILKYLYNK